MTRKHQQMTTSQRRSPAQWYQLVEAQSSSGLSQRAFCEQQQISYPSFGYWRKKLSLFEFAIHTEREDYLKMLVFKFKHLKGMHPKSSKVLPLVISLLNKDQDALEHVKILLDQGANINAQTHEGETALLTACVSTNSLALVELLVERGADVNLSNNNGCTPLMDAAELGKNDILEYLLNNGADINAKKFNRISALDLARNTENTNAIEILVSKSKDNE